MPGPGPGWRTGTTTEFCATLGFSRPWSLPHLTSSPPAVLGLAVDCRPGAGPGPGTSRCWRPGARIRLGRLQGRGRARQDPAHADQRSGRGRSARPCRARPGPVRGQGHDVLRRLDRQVRDCCQARRHGRHHHPHRPAAYPWDVVRSGGNAEQFSLVQAKGGDDPDAPPVPGGIQQGQAKAMLAAAGYDFDTLKQQALTRDFRPVALKSTASFKVDNQSRTIDSHNVVALIEGSDPQLKHELVVECRLRIPGCRRPPPEISRHKKSQAEPGFLALLTTAEDHSSAVGAASMSVASGRSSSST